MSNICVLKLMNKKFVVFTTNYNMSCQVYFYVLLVDHWNSSPPPHFFENNGGGFLFLATAGDSNPTGLCPNPTG